MTDTVMSEVDRLEFSDANDADQLLPPEPEIPTGRVPDHRETAGQDDPGAGTSDTGSKLKPWERIAQASGLTSGTGSGTGSSSGARTGGSRRPKQDGPVPNLPRNFESDLADVYRTIGSMFYPFDAMCGQAIIDAAPECAGKLVALARTNADVRRVLLKFVGTSALGAVIAAHTPILMAVVMHHVTPLIAKRNAAAAEAMAAQNGFTYDNANVHPLPTQQFGQN